MVLNLYHVWIPNSSEELKKVMLRYIGRSFDELIEDIPRELILRRDLEVGFGRPLSEYELIRIYRSYMDKNRKPKIPPFMGGGLCPTYIPQVVRYLASRGEFYTAYTPYQPEINQGILQALFEYQSMMAELYSIDVVNASMYDGSTAVAEAFRLAMRVTRRKAILAPEIMNPFYRRVAETWIEPVGGKIIYYRVDRGGQPDLEDLEDKADRETAAIYLENPTYLGNIVEKPEELKNIAGKTGSLYIVFSEPTSLAIFKPPGEYGADIVVGEGASLGLGLNYGGTTLGILGVRRDQSLIRQLPGKLVGMTTDLKGSERGFTLILQTREQHIRRERATSNITTNAALMAVQAAIYISYLGMSGLRRLAETIARKTRYAIDHIYRRREYMNLAIGARYFYREVPIRFRGDYGTIYRRLVDQGIYPGIRLDPLLKGFSNCGLFCFSDVHSRDDIDLLFESIDKVI